MQGEIGSDGLQRLAPLAQRDLHGRIGFLKQRGGAGKRLRLALELGGHGRDVAQNMGGDVAQCLDLVRQDRRRRAGIGRRQFQRAAQAVGLTGQAGLNRGELLAAFDDDTLKLAVGLVEPGQHGVDIGAEALVGGGHGFNDRAGLLRQGGQQATGAFIKLAGSRFALAADRLHQSLAFRLERVGKCPALRLNAFDDRSTAGLDGLNQDAAA